MDLGIVGVVELLQQKAALRGGDLFRLCNGSAHALRGGSEDEIGTECLQEDASFHAH